jgi:NAD(P)-dependent dehydrogenase (short-subunit alcohol dehydrogenase family)
MEDSRPEVGAGVADADLSGQTVVVTGATDGIGRETALALGRLGAHVVVHGRDRQKGAAVIERLASTAADGTDLLLADFATQAAVREFAADLRERRDAIDVLVNNAGGYFTEGRRTEDGVEYTIAVNHLAPFLLTHELLDRLAATDGRVVNVSSDAHRGAAIDFESFRAVDSYAGWTAYGQSKLANVLFTRELHRRLRAAGSGVTTDALHPGGIPGTSFARNMPLPARLATRAVETLPDALTGPFVTTVAEGAATPVYLAVTDEAGEGDYYAGCRRRRPARAARNDDLARRLWRVSADCTGVERDAIAPATD